MDNPDVFILTVLMDEYQPHTCSSWAAAGNQFIPAVVRGGTSIAFGGSGGLEGLFFAQGGIPKRVFIDHEFNIYSIDNGYQTDAEIKQIIDEMLEIKETSE